MNILEKILSTLTMAGLFIFVVLNAGQFGQAVKAASGSAASYVNAVGRGTA